MTDTATTVDLSRYLTDSTASGSRWWLWEFPNGHSVSVIPDPRRPLRFEVQTTDPADEPAGGITAGLSTEQVEARLLAVYALPAKDQNEEPEPAVALVTVNEKGHLTPDSTVTVGEFTWPVPEKAEHGGVLWAARVGQVLREHGYRPTAIDVNEENSPAGTVTVRVQPINDET